MKILQNFYENWGNDHFGVLCGLQDTVMFPIPGVSSAILYNPVGGKRLAHMDFSKVGNKFAIKLGLTTRW
ncbi:MAG: hypothetical protein P1P59_11505 [Treponemataceae bacterium]